MAVPAFIGDNVQDAASGLSLTFTIPAAAASGDFMIAFVKQSENTSQRIWDDDGGGGNGWTREAYNRTTSGRDQETAVFWKFHSGSESNPTFTWASGITAEPMSGSLLVYRGVDTTTPFTSVSYASGTNDANPPNPSVPIISDNTRVVCFHAATHDDISSVSAPTGFTLRTQVWSGTSNDHRNHFTADIEVDALGTYTPPDWQHSVLNTTPEYHTYAVALNEVQPIGISDVNTDEQIDLSETNIVITGYGFGATQGSGKLEIWSDASGTVKSIQTIDNWSDTSIQFDFVQGSLSEGTNYVVVTNDSAEENAPYVINIGLAPYTDLVLTMSPDHYWKLNNTYDDTGITGPTRNMTNGVIGGGAFTTATIAEDTTHSWHCNSITVRREIADSTNMNITSVLDERTVVSWIQLNTVQQSMACLWKEGGGVQNLAFIAGLGNVLIGQMADVTTKDNVQAFSDIKLSAGRPYHIAMRYSYDEAPKEFRLYVDGIEQQITDGNPLTAVNFDTHSGDVVWGDSDTNLETGGTDIAYAGPEDCYFSHFAGWSSNSANKGALDKTNEIHKLFEFGAKPDANLSTGTEPEMQTALDAFADTARPDAPLAFRVQGVSGGGDLELIADNITFNPRVSLQIQYMGASSDTLTWVNTNGSVTNNAKFSTPNGGTITVIDTVTVSIEVRDIVTKAVIQDARVLLEADTGGPLPAGTDILSGFTNASGIIEDGGFRYTADQPVTGRVRKSTSSTYYMTSNVQGSISSTGLQLTILMVRDE